MTKKEQLYYMLNTYNKGEYSVSAFCNAFEEVFYPDIPYDELTPHELDVLKKLGERITRFSPFEEDLKNYPKVYFSDKNINDAIKECCFHLFS